MTDKELRALDAWIAEHVMGFRQTFNPDDHTTDGATLFWHRKEPGKKEVVLVGRAYAHRGLTREYGKEIFSHSWSTYEPTTDRAAAMEVLEKCAEKISFANIEIFCTHNAAPKWNIAKEGCADLHEAPTLPLAICLFCKAIYEKAN